MANIAALGSATMLQSGANAAEAERLGSIVVTATGFEQNVAEAPASITVVTREELEKGTFRDLTDALREVQGVTVTGTANEEDIYIRGLPGVYTLILVDGKRQSTRDTRPNGSAGYEQSFIPPLAAIDRIEVIRGPMSSLYGSDAMGGVINIITRKVAPEWSGEFALEGTVQEHRDSRDSGQASFYVSGPVIEDTLGLQLWGRAYARGEDKFVGGITSAREVDLTGKFVFTPNEDHDFEFGAGITRLRRQAEPNRTQASDTDARRSDHDRWNWSAGHTGRWGGFTTDLHVTQEWGQRTTYDRDINGNFVENARAPQIRNTVVEGKATVPHDLFGQHISVIGGQFQNAKLTDQNPGSRTGEDETFSINQWALFVEDEWELFDRFALTTGLRLDHHEVYGSHVSPRIYGVWEPIDQFFVKGGISTGFRAPEIRQIAPGYANTTGGRGCTYGPDGTCGVIIANPDMEPEKSTNYEFGLLWEGHAISGGATFFWTEFSDKIANALVLDSNGDPLRWDEDPNYRLWHYFNIDDARMRGVELAGTWQATDTLTVRGSYTYTDSKQRTGDFVGFPLARTPEHAATLGADWKTPITGLDANATMQFHGSEIAAGPRLGSNGKSVFIKGVEGKKYDPYALFNVGASYELTDSVTLRASVYNLFDKSIGATDFNTIQDGRRFWMGVTASF